MEEREVAQRDAGPVAALRLVAEREGAGVLDEEVPLLRKEERKAGQVDLLLVDLDLGEVRVVREVERQPRRDPELHVEPDVGLAACAPFLDQRPRLVLHERVGLHPQVESRPHAPESGQRPRLRHLVDLVPPIERRPEGVLRLAPDAAQDLESPRLVVLRRIEAERGERDLDLYRPPLVMPGRLDADGAFPRLVLGAAVVEELDVLERPAGIHEEHEPVAAVEVRIERHAEDVR